MVKREVKSTVVNTMASTATRFRVRLARRLRKERCRTHLRFATFMVPPPYRVTIRPSSMRTMRSAIWAISSLWVIITMV